MQSETIKLWGLEATSGMEAAYNFKALPREPKEKLMVMKSQFLALRDHALNSFLASHSVRRLEAAAAMSTSVSFSEAGPVRLFSRFCGERCREATSDGVFFRRPPFSRSELFTKGTSTLPGKHRSLNDRNIDTGSEIIPQLDSSFRRLCDGTTEVERQGQTQVKFSPNSCRCWGKASPRE